MPRCLSEFSFDDALEFREEAMDEIEAIDFNGIRLDIAIVLLAIAACGSAPCHPVIRFRILFLMT